MYDAIVAGGGTAGAVCAITCAKFGLKTLLIEDLSYLGGTQTAGLVTPMMSALVEGMPAFGAVNQEIIKRLEETGDGNGYWFNPEMLKHVLEEMYLAHGGELLYLSKIINVVKEGNQIKGVVVANKNGVETKHARFVVDATGDGDIASLAGASFQMGRGDANACQPVSLRFEAANINLKEFAQFLKDLGQTETEAEKTLAEETFYGAHTLDGVWPLSPVFQKALAEGDLTEDDCKYFQFFAIPGKPNTLAFNCPEIFGPVDPVCQEDVSWAIVEGRRAIRRLMHFMKKNFAGFQNAYLSCSAQMLGIRDSRRIIGEYELCAADLAGYRKFDDGIVQCNYYMDVHGIPDEEKEKIEKLRAQTDIPLKERFYTIPFRSCIPKGLDGLLVAGRCISADFLAQSAIRIQLACRAMGEACGYAAYLGCTEGRQLRELDYQMISRYMLEDKGSSI